MFRSRGLRWLGTVAAATALLDVESAERGRRQSMALTTLVVPCYNEAGRLHAARFEHFAEQHADVRFVMVDDGSTDRTLDRLRELEARVAGIRVLALPKNLGKAEAVRRGMQEAFSLEPGFVGYWDADLATPLEAVDDFLAVLESRPALLGALGSRVKLLGRRIQRSALRHYPGRIFATLASAALNLPVYDTQCGAKLFRCTPEIREVFREPFSSRWIFDVEILARLAEGRRGTSEPSLEDVLYEVSLGEWADVGESKVKATDLLHALWQLLRIRARYRLR